MRSISPFAAIASHSIKKVRMAARPRREDYEVLASFCEELPLLVNHQPFITSSGGQPVGRVINFAVIDGEPFNIPSGVLAYAELDRS
jgi:hypothetical protein